MKKWGIWRVVWIIILIITISNIVWVVVKGYNVMASLEERANEYWTELEGHYKRRYDLIPNLVNTIKGYAEHERETLTAVTEARAKVGGMVKIDPSAATSEQLKQFQQSQAGLGSILQQLLAVAEQYPQLKANQNFTEFQSQLSGTENRIAIEKRRFSQAVMAYNAKIRKFPTNIMASVFGFKRYAQF